MARVSLPTPPATMRASVVPTRPPAEVRANVLRKVVLNLVLVALAGGLHAVGWLFPGAWPFVWIGQAAFVALGALNAPRTALVLGTLAGALGIGAAFHWGVEALKLTIDAQPWLAWSIFLVLVVIEGVSLGVFCLVAALISRRGVRAMWLIPFAWAAIEHWYPRLFPWQIAYSQLEVLPLLQIADLVGSTGIGFVITAVAAIPVIGVLSFRSTRSADRRWAAAYAAGALLLLAATWSYGLVRQWQWAAWDAAQPKVKVALIQVDPAYVGSEQKIRDLTVPLCDQVDLICWPETSIGTYSEELQHFRDPDLTLRLSRNSRESLTPNKELRRHLLAGGKLYRPDADDEGPYSMAAFLIGPDEGILGRYRKRTLLPFGEYAPFESQFPVIRKWCTLQYVMEAGTDARPLVTENGQRLGVLICYEDTLPRAARHTVAAGAQVLISLIQGTAFENPLTLRQHLRLAALRAVENRRYFVRCASTGVTCIISPTGQVLSQLPLQTDGALIGEFAGAEGQSCYTAIGDAFPWCATLIVALGLLRLRSSSVSGGTRTWL